jgi:acyl-CoA dehydrogenase
MNAERSFVVKPARSQRHGRRRTRLADRCAREAAQVLGGASYVKGTKTEWLYRGVRIMALGGGSEEILLGLAGRQLGYI